MFFFQFGIVATVYTVPYYLKNLLNYFINSCSLDSDDLTTTICMGGHVIQRRTTGIGNTLSSTQ